MASKKAMAKRAEPPAVRPITYKGVQYEVLYEPVGGKEAVCSVIARETGAAKPRWKTVLYRIRYDKKMETDVQDAWPRSLGVEGRDVVVVNERNEVFRADRVYGNLKSETHL